MYIIFQIIFKQYERKELLMWLKLWGCREKPVLLCLFCTTPMSILMANWVLNNGLCQHFVQKLVNSRDEQNRACFLRYKVFGKEIIITALGSCCNWISFSPCSSFRWELHINYQIQYLIFTPQLISILQRSYYKHLSEVNYKCV